MVRALVSFSGTVSMHKGETRVIEDTAILNDLLSAGYVEVVKNENKRSDRSRGEKVSESGQ